jgi:FlaA1/EpsC-like NDP-sugar epimerase
VKVLNRYRSPYDLLLPLGDVLFAVLICGAVRQFIVLIDESPWMYEGVGMLQSGAIASFVIVAFYFADLYHIETEFTLAEHFLSLMKGFGAVCLITGAVSAFVPAVTGFEGIRLIDLMLVGAGLFLWHQIYARGLVQAPTRRVLIVGTNAISRLIAGELQAKRHLRMEVVGFLGANEGELTVSGRDRREISRPVFPRESIVGLVNAEAVDTILIDGPGSCADFAARDLLALRLRGVKFEDFHSFYERVMSQIPITDLHPGVGGSRQGIPLRHVGCGCEEDHGYRSFQRRARALCSGISANGRRDQAHQPRAGDLSPGTSGPERAPFHSLQIPLHAS